LFVAFIFICLSIQAQVSNLKRDQEVVFFPTLACRSGSNCWDLTIRGCVYEPDKRTLALALIRAALGLEHVSLTREENKLFAERARLFMVDHKGGRKVVIRIGETEFTLPKTGANGDFSTVIQLSDAQVQELRNLSAALRAVFQLKTTAYLQATSASLMMLASSSFQTSMTQSRSRKWATEKRPCATRSLSRFDLCREWRIFITVGLRKPVRSSATYRRARGNFIRHWRILSGRMDSRQASFI